MRPSRWIQQQFALSSVCAIGLACTRAEAQAGDGVLEDLTQRFESAPGVRVTLWAESPMLFNPTAMDVDGRGRLWVTEAVNYRRWGDRNPGRDHSGGDRVVILEDTDQDGVADSSKVFVQDPELVAPLGICVVGSRVYVSCSPNIFIYTDEDGDDISDSREVFLTGFGGFDHDHGVHSVVAGDDGYLYIAAGNAGPHLVEGKDGFRLRSGSIYRGGSPYNGKNSSGMRSSDGRVWNGGIMLRIRPDGTGMEVLAHNFRNQYEVALDSFGNMFTADNDDDGNRGCRTTWVAESGNYGFFSEDGSRSWQADRRPGQETQAAHWHAEDPGVMPPGTINGAGGPTGVAVYEHSGAAALAGMHGAVLNCDAGAGKVYAHLPEPWGAGLHLEPGVLLGRAKESGRKEGDGQGVWFRPSDVVVTPTGEVLVADWYDPGVGGHAARDRESYGRILRVSSSAGGAAPQRGSNSRVVDLLSNPSPSVRATAVEELISRGQPAIDELAACLGSTDPRLAARATWALARMGQAGAERIKPMLSHDSAELRLTAYRALVRFGHADPAELGRRMASDESARVRGEVLRSMRDLSWEQARDTLITAFQEFEAHDRYYLEAFGTGADGKEEEVGAFLLGASSLADYLADSPPRSSHNSEHRDDLLWRLHPELALGHLAALAMDPDTPPAKRRRMQDAMAFIPTRSAADAMFAAAFAGPLESRAHAQFWIEHRAGNLWRDYGLRAGTVSAGLENADMRWSSGTVSSGLINFDVSVAGSKDLRLVVSDAGDGFGCDWADWVAPRFLMEDGSEISLTDLGWSREESGWGSTHMNKNCSGAPLRVGDEVLPVGIGTHAPAMISFAVPAGALRLVGQVGPDFGGTSQGCGSTMEFQVWSSGPKDRSMIQALRAAVMDAQKTAEARAEAARNLASSPEGALFLIGLAEQEQLDERVIEATAAAIYQNPDLGVRALASAHFPLPGAAGRKLPPVAKLLTREGDPLRGQEIFQSERAQCSACHTFRGLGKDIGPDLTAVRTKYGTPEVLDSILNPSVGIAFGYDTYLVATHEGEMFSGFLLADGEDVILKDTQGQRHVIPADDIEVRKKQEKSVMPEGVALDLSGQELVDLVAFLMQDHDREPEFGQPIELFNGRDLSGWIHHLRIKGADPAKAWSVQDGVIRCEGRPAGYIRTEADYESYELTLEWRFDPERGAGNSGVLLRMVGADKVWPKSIEAQLHSGNAGDIWNIDRFQMVTDQERTSGRRTRKAEPTFELPLGGWNQYRIVLDHGSLTLEVNGVVQNSADWCEVLPGKICLQSEGAYIEFRKIILRPIIN